MLGVLTGRGDARWEGWRGLAFCVLDQVIDHSACLIDWSIGSADWLINLPIDCQLVMLMSALLSHWLSTFALHPLWSMLYCLITAFAGCVGRTACYRVMASGTLCGHSCTSCACWPTSSRCRSSRGTTASSSPSPRTTSMSTGRCFPANMAHHAPAKMQCIHIFDGILPAYSSHLGRMCSIVSSNDERSGPSRCLSTCWHLQMA